MRTFSDCPPLKIKFWGGEAKGKEETIVSRKEKKEANKLISQEGRKNIKKIIDGGKVEIAD